MTEKDKTIDGMAVRKSSVKRRTTGIDGLRPASGTKTTVSRAVRMRQAEKVLREREAKERVARQARERMAKIQAAQLRTAGDNMIRHTKTPIKPVEATPKSLSTASKTPNQMMHKMVVKRVTSDNYTKTQRTTVIQNRPIQHQSAQNNPTLRRMSEQKIQTELPSKNTNTPARARVLTQQRMQNVREQSVLGQQGQKQTEKINRSEGRLVHTEAVKSFLEPVSTFEDTAVHKLKRKTPKKVEEEVKKPKKKKSFFRWFRRLFILLIIAGIGFGYAWSNGLVSKITGGKSNFFDIIGVVTNPDVELKTGNNGRTNVLVFGTSGYEMDGSGHDGAQLTDSIMVVSFDKESKDVAMINLPRDLYVGNTCTPTGKVNELYWCANPADRNEEAGAKALSDAVTRVLGMDIQYYAHLNWGALVQIVDSIGGVTVTLDENINDNWTNTYIQAGVPVALNGEQALGLARARHGTEQGDFSRGASQQKLLIALEEKVLEQGLDIGQALSLINSLGDNLRTSFSLEEIKTIVHLAADINIAGMRQVALSNPANNIYYITSTMMPVNGYDVSFVVPTAGTTNYTAIKKYVSREFSTDVATRENANILVLNGTGEVGVASREQDELENSGFTVGEIDDAPDGEYPSHYYLYNVSNRCPGTQASLEKRYSVSATPIETLPEGISGEGFDFIVIIGQQEE